MQMGATGGLESCSHPLSLPHFLAIVYTQDSHVLEVKEVLPTSGVPTGPWPRAPSANPEVQPLAGEISAAVETSASKRVVRPFPGELCYFACFHDAVWVFLAAHRRFDPTLSRRTHRSVDRDAYIHRVVRFPVSSRVVLVLVRTTVYRSESR